MNKLHRSRYINVVVSMMMAFLMLAAMGTTQVHAAQYTTGTIDPAELKAGDVVYRGVQLTVDRQIVVCKKCNMIWITTGTDYGTGDMKRSEVVATEAHKDHPDKVGYSEFNWYFNLDSSGPLLKNTPYTIVENANIKYKIIYNTNGGSQIAEEKQTSLPDPLPAATKDGYEFAGWYTDADFTTIARPGQALTADTTLYAKWVEHRHTFKNEWSSNDTSHWHAATCEHTTEKKDEAAHVYGTAGAERYTCSVCKYVSETRKREAEAADKKNTESEPVKVKRTEAKDAALNSKFNVKAGKTVKVTWGKVKDADGYDVYMAYCGKDKEKVVMAFSFIGAIGRKDNLLDDIFQYAHVRNGAAEAGLDQGSSALSKERIIAIDPDVFLLPTWNFDSNNDVQKYAQQVAADPAFKNIKAIKNNRLEFVSDRYRYVASQHVTDSIEAVAKAVYPELFAKGE